MLHILLLLLKIIGILLLVIPGLLLLALLAVLLVPVRYQGRGSFYKTPEGSLRITWLLHLISVRVTYREELDIAVRLLGFRLFKTGPGEEDGVAEDVGAKDGGGKDGEAEEPLLGIQELGESPREPQESQEPQEPQEPWDPQDSQEPQSPPPKRRGFLERIGAKLAAFFKRLVSAARQLCRGLKKAEDFKNTLLQELEDEENRKTFRLVIRQLKRVVRHLKPLRLTGTVTFGLEDPYVMGQILTGAAFLYPMYARQLILTPVFDQSILEGEAALRGRIRMGTLLTAGVRLLLNKNFRRQLRRFLNRGGI